MKKQARLKEIVFIAAIISLILSIFTTTVSSTVNQQIIFNERQIRAVEYLKVHKRITNKEYRELFSVVKDTANRDLNNMLKKELIEKKGTGPKVYYVLKTTVRYRPIGVIK